MKGRSVATKMVLIIFVKNLIVFQITDHKRAAYFLHLTPIPWGALSSLISKRTDNFFNNSVKNAYFFMIQSSFERRNLDLQYRVTGSFFCASRISETLAKAKFWSIFWPLCQSIGIFSMNSNVTESFWIMGLWRVLNTLQGIKWTFFLYFNKKNVFFWGRIFPFSGVFGNFLDDPGINTLPNTISASNAYHWKAYFVPFWMVLFFFFQVFEFSGKSRKC